MKRSLFPLMLVVLSACGDSSDGAGAPKTEDTPTEPENTFADLVAIDQIAVYQGVKVTLADERQIIETKKINAPVIPQRPALVRVHAKGLQPRTKVRATAELHIHVKGKPDAVFTDKAKTLVSLDDATMSSTFNFDVPPEAIDTGATLDVAVHDETSPDQVVTFPEDGSALPMNVGPLAPTLRVKFVPVKYDADGSGRTPDMSASAIENYKNALYRWYPTSNVEVNVRDTLRWPMQVDPNGDGWDKLLNAVMTTRTDDLAPDDMYYIAVFDPTDDVSEWCAEGGCVLGIAPQALLRDVSMRVAMITGYPDNEGTLAQELGHAMGRAHAPCGGAQYVDPDYPYARANIGVFGWDIVDKQLVDPDDRVYDFMSYCHPNWVSDYTFAGLYERMVKVAQTKRVEGEVSGGAGGAEKDELVQLTHVRPDGTTRPGARVRARDLDLDGDAMRSIAGKPGSLRVDRIP